MRCALGRLVDTGVPTSLVSIMGALLRVFPSVELDHSYSAE